MQVLKFLVTDDQGNRNNFLVAPKQKTNETKEIQQPSAIPFRQGVSATLGKPGMMNTLHETGVGDEAMAAGAGQRKPNSKDLKRPPNSNSSGTAEIPQPALIVEKTDAEPRHGDNFGDKATVDQREAYRMRSLDANPDQVIVRDKAAMESADTAAEVADAAAALDIEQPTPPITDVEAGRIGFRRLSQTPIADVAAVASEVSDSAALLDMDEHIVRFLNCRSTVRAPLLTTTQLRIEMPPQFTMNDTSPDSRTPGSGEVTPSEDRAPRFAHECVQRPQHEEEPQRPPEVRERSSEEEGESIDLNDPSIEDFPCERHLIIERVRTSASRLSEDETVFEGVSSSPVVGANQADRSESSFPPGPVPGKVRTPSLDSIPEEHAHEGETTSVLPSAMRKNAQSQLEGEGNGQHEALTGHREEPASTAEPYEPNPAALQPEVELTQNTVPARTFAEAGIQGTTCDARASVQAHPDSGAISAGQTMDGAHTEADSFQSLPPVPDSGSQAARDAEGDREPSLPEEWPAVLNIPSAAPTSSLKARAGHHLPDPPAMDTAVSSAVESGHTSRLTSHKAASPPPERPLTPSSMRSANLVAKSRDLLKNILRLIFVDWIGGLIQRLCGRRGRT